MKKTYIYNLLLLSILMVTASSCKKPLDINPVDDVEQGQALTTPKAVESALIGAYADLGSRNFYGGRAALMSDFLADTTAINWTGTYEELTQTINKSLLKTNLFVDNVWRDGFKTINDVNNVLAALDKLDEDRKGTVEGESKFIRGAAYFNLVRLFGKSYNVSDPATNLGVPIVLTPTTLITDANYVARASVADVYIQAIKDLTEAEALLPDENGFFATKSAAAAMLARIYLQMGNYIEAAKAADRVISSGLYQLAATYSGAFPVKQKAGNPAQAGSNTDEDVFAVQVTKLAGFNGFNEFYGSSTYNGRGDASIYEDWIDETFTEDDARRDYFYDDEGDLYTSKFANTYGNVPVIRLAEMYLIRAEGNVRMGKSIGDTPLADLAKVRTRAGLETATATLDDILKERRLEFSFEGFALHDVKRTEGKIGKIEWNDDRLVFPIPQREMDANKKLVQNAGY